MRPTVAGALRWTGSYPFMATLKPHSNGPQYSNTVIGTLAVDGWAATFGTARRGLGRLGPRPVTQSPPRCTKCNSPPINGQCTNFIVFDVAVLLPLESKELKVIIITFPTADDHGGVLFLMVCLFLCLFVCLSSRLHENGNSCRHRTFTRNLAIANRLRVSWAHKY